MKPRIFTCFIFSIFAFQSCAEFGIKPSGSVTGKEARAMIQQGLLLVTLLDYSAASSSDYSTRVGGTYELTFDLLNPYMVKLDDDAYYSKTEVKKCVDSISRISFTVSSTLASFECKLKPLSVIGI